VLAKQLLQNTKFYRKYWEKKVRIKTRQGYFQNPQVETWGDGGRQTFLYSMEKVVFSILYSVYIYISAFISEYFLSVYLRQLLVKSRLWFVSRLWM
jgi:hypothetical protein